MNDNKEEITKVVELFSSSNGGVYARVPTTETEEDTIMFDETFVASLMFSILALFISRIDDNLQNTFIKNVYKNLNKFKETGFSHVDNISDGDWDDKQ